MHSNRSKQVKDVMIPLIEYPHVQLNVNIYDALLEIREKATKGFHQLLIFDKSRLIASVTGREILRAMVPGVFRAECHPKFEGYCSPDDPSLAILWEDSFLKDCRNKLMTPLVNIISPSPITTVDSEALITKALFLMLRDDKNALPVISNNSIAGVVQLPNILDIIIDTCEEGRDKQ